VYHVVHADAVPEPVLVSIDVPQDLETVFAFLDVMANHEPFNDHLMRDWELSGSPRRRRLPSSRPHPRARDHRRRRHRGGGLRPPTRIVERNVATKAGRTGEGTYTLAARADGGTRITFEYRWIVAPLLDRLLAPVVRAFIRRNNETSMRRWRNSSPTSRALDDHPHG
jgi:hypothetical protein